MEGDALHRILGEMIHHPHLCRVVVRRLLLLHSRRAPLVSWEEVVFQVTVMERGQKRQHHHHHHHLRKRGLPPVALSHVKILTYLQLHHGAVVLLILVDSPVEEAVEVREVNITIPIVLVRGMRRRPHQQQSQTRNRRIVWG